MALITTKFLGNGRTHTVYNVTGKEMTTDVDKSNGGLGENPNPVMLLCSSLAACALSVIGMSAKKMNLDASGCWAEVTDVKEDFDTYQVTHIALTIHLKAEFEPSARKRLEAYAHKACFVGNSLKAEKEFTFVYE
ncbi:MAG: OsmC family protein [Prevotella sp.]|jgi:uncharacterized OsmC-like protein